MNQAGRLPARLLMAGVCTLTLAGGALGALSAQAPADAACVRALPAHHRAGDRLDQVPRQLRRRQRLPQPAQRHGQLHHQVADPPPPADNMVAAYPHLARGCEFPAPMLSGMHQRPDRETGHPDDGLDDHLDHQPHRGG